MSDVENASETRTRAVIVFRMRGKCVIKAMVKISFGNVAKQMFFTYTECLTKSCNRKVVKNKLLFSVIKMSLIKTFFELYFSLHFLIKNYYKKKE